MGVDQAGQEREIAQIDGAGAGWDAARSHAPDLPIGNDHHRGRDQLTPGQVHHPRGAHNRGLLCAGREHLGDQ